MSPAPPNSKAHPQEASTVKIHTSHGSPAPTKCFAESTCGTCSGAAKQYSLAEMLFQLELEPFYIPLAQREHFDLTGSPSALQSCSAPRQALRHPRSTQFTVCFLLHAARVLRQAGEAMQCAQPVDTETVANPSLTRTNPWPTRALNTGPHDVATLFSRRSFIVCLTLGECIL